MLIFMRSRRYRADAYLPSDAFRLLFEAVARCFGLLASSMPDWHSYCTLAAVRGCRDTSRGPAVSPVTRTLFLMRRAASGSQRCYRSAGFGPAPAISSLRGREADGRFEITAARLSLARPIFRRRTGLHALISIPAIGAYRDDARFTASGFRLFRAVATLYATSLRLYYHLMARERGRA